MQRKKEKKEEEGSSNAQHTYAASFDMTCGFVTFYVSQSALQCRPHVGAVTNTPYVVPFGKPPHIIPVRKLSYSTVFSKFKIIVFFFKKGTYNY